MRRVHDAAKLTPLYVCKMGIVASSLRFIARPFAALAGKKPTLTPYGNELPSLVHFELKQPELRPSGRFIVVGDVHGCCDELDLLLKECNATEHDNVVLVGDLVNKGPKSVEVLDRVLDQGFWAVRGNHDEAALQCHSKWAAQQPFKERFSWVAQLQARHVQLLARLPFSLAVPEYGLLVVHAGLVPGVGLARQRLSDLVLMRDIAGAGSQGTRSSRWQGLEKPAAGSRAWAANWAGPQHVLFGHDAKRKLQQHPHATGLDTGCVYGFRLTAAVFPPLQQLQQSEVFTSKLAAGQPLLFEDLQGQLVAVEALAVHEPAKKKEVTAGSAAEVAGSAAGAAPGATGVLGQQAVDGGAEAGVAVGEEAGVQQDHVATAAVR